MPMRAATEIAVNTPDLHEDANARTERSVRTTRIVHACGYGIQCSVHSVVAWGQHVRRHSHVFDREGTGAPTFVEGPL